MTPQKLLLIHIGMGRAGSSAIQRFLTLNRDHLFQRGWIYPDKSAFGLPARSTSVGNLTFLALLSRDGKSIDEPMRHFSAYLDKVGPRCVVLSSEWAMGAGSEFLQHFARVAEERGFSMRVLVYFREQREWLLSAYAQKIKSQDWTLTAEEYLKQYEHGRKLNYHSKYLKLVRAFGREKVFARIYERGKLVGSDVQSDLLSVMKLDPAHFSMLNSSVNASADLVEVELMRLINKYQGNRKIDKKKLLDISLGMNRERDRRLYSLVSPELLRSILQRYQKSNSKLQKEMDLPGPLFNSSIPDDFDMVDPKHLVTETAVAILLAYILASGESELQGVAIPATP